MSSEWNAAQIGGLRFSVARKWRETVHPASVTDSLWTVRFDADGDSHKSTDVDDVRDTSDAKRKRLTHKQTWEPRKDHDDIVERDARKRFKQTEKQSPSSSSAIPYQVARTVSSILERSASAADTATESTYKPGC